MPPPSPCPAGTGDSAAAAAAVSAIPTAAAPPASVHDELVNESISASCDRPEWLRRLLLLRRRELPRLAPSSLPSTPPLSRDDRLPWLRLLRPDELPLRRLRLLLRCRRCRPLDLLSPSRR